VAVLPVNLPPAEAVAFYRRKGLELSFDWRDLHGEEHAKAFTVAKVMQADILRDLHEAVDRAISEGVPLEKWRKELEPVLREKGWWGRKAMEDPLTGEVREVQLGSPRRLRTIYDTNLRTSHAAGRWQQIQRTKARRPFLRYVHQDNANPRQHHKALHGLVLPVESPFWATHYPPNDFGCHCTVQQLSDRDLTRYGYKVAERAPTPQLERWENPRTGAVRMVPRGVRPGFDQHHGHAAEGAARLFGERLLEARPDVGAQLWSSSGPELADALQGGFTRWAAALERGAVAPAGDLYPVGGLSPATLAGIRGAGRKVGSAGIVVRDGDLVDMIGGARQLGLFDGDAARVVLELPALLGRARAVLLDRAAGSLVYVLDAPGRKGAGAEFVVRVALRATRGAAVPNHVAGAELVAREALADPSAFAVLEGAL
jgi:SPP1 gp7 family putative phage head morphogenesis protein